ncbi:putative bifunctional diguanylate cyclase/phosphodiesterase [Kineococcus sp. SYSU DK005]|uniref:putative bifunctional diguanylate cyclase/phosphodiesterase n=1 Tax=Kineococcus sp. SYSU DK005 TaxID=3383126 RepID=UPI003D7F063B
MVRWPWSARHEAGDDVRARVVPWALGSPLVVVGVVSLVHRLLGGAPGLETLLAALCGGLVSALLLLLLAAQAADRVDADARHRQDMLDAALRQALHDPLTDLGNRQLFTDRLQHALARRGSRGCAVLYLDLDGFKSVNDTHGHAAGDAVLVEVAHRLRAAVRPEDTVARFGGDEFAVLCEDLSDDLTASRIAERVVSSIADRPIAVGPERALSITPSVGIALARDEGDASRLLRRADAALYRAKEGGKARSELFDERMQAQAVDASQTEVDLAMAVEQGQLRLHYQPIVDLTDGHVQGVEALLRWQHPRRGLLHPGDFVPLAERTGLIVPIGQWVIREAWRTLQEWYAREGEDCAFTVSVNVSPRQLANAQLLDAVAAEQPAGPAGSALILEVSEELLVADANAGFSTLHALRMMGVRVGVDDFGRGVSSLSHLQTMPVDHVKVDRHFIAGLGRRHQDEAVVAGIIGMARSMGVGVIAEGVETTEQLSALRRMGCDAAQGFLLAHPGPVVDRERVLPEATAGMLHEVLHLDLDHHVPARRAALSPDVAAR